jgi:hypothetical protein
MDGSGKKRKWGKDKQPASFQGIFEVKTMFETYNRPAALYLERQPDEFFVEDGRTGHDVSKRDNEETNIYERVSEQVFCRSFLEKSKNNGDVYPMSYKKGLNDVAEDQRWFATGNSMQGCPSKLRNTLCKGKYIDVDMQNCGPMILEQLCKKYDIDCPNLSDYNQHREDRLNEFSPYLDRGQAKTLIIRLLNGGSVQEQEREEVDGVDWLPGFTKELSKIRRKVAKEYPAIIGRYPTNKPNLDAKVVSALVYAEENKILEQYYHFFKTTGIIKNGECVLIFDGLMVRDSKCNREHLTTDFLFRASKHVAESRVLGGYGCVKDYTDLLLTIRIKEFGEGYVLPADYETTPGNFFVITPGDDKAAADILTKAAGDRLVKCPTTLGNGRYFFRHAGCIYREGEHEARDGLLNLAKDVCIVVDVGGGKTANYTRDIAKMRGCIQFILADQAIIIPRFVEKLWASNLLYLAYTNGVYSFKEGRLLTFEEAVARSIFFTQDTGRAFTAEVDEEVKKELVRRVIAPMFPDVSQRDFFLTCLSRAMAGHIEDKWWFAITGQRNSGKSKLCEQLRLAFGPFVQDTNAENLMVKDSVQDAAKARSWMRPLEMKRFVYTHEMPKGGTKKIDGQMIKQICSGGDYIQCRTNFTNEVEIQMQATFGFLQNDMAEVDSADAYQTMIGIKCDNEFHDQADINAMKEQGDAVPANWLAMDHKIDEYIRRPEVIDAFTSVLFNYYKPDRQIPPLRVQEDTASIKGDASVSVEERFANVIIKGGDCDVLTYKDIQLALINGGMEKFSNGKIDTYVKNIYNIRPSQPSRENASGTKVQVRGFSGLKILFDFTNPHAST